MNEDGRSTFENEGGGRNAGRKGLKFDVGWLFGWKLSGKNKGAASKADGGKAAHMPGLPCGPNGSGVAGQSFDPPAMPKGLGNPKGLVVQGVVGCADEGVAGAETNMGANLCRIFGSAEAGRMNMDEGRALGLFEDAAVGVKLVVVVVGKVVVVVVATTTFIGDATVGAGGSSTLLAGGAATFFSPLRFTGSHSPHCAVSVTSVTVLPGSSLA